MADKVKDVAVSYTSKEAVRNTKGRVVEAYTADEEEMRKVGKNRLTILYSELSVLFQNDALDTFSKALDELAEEKRKDDDWESRWEQRISEARTLRRACAKSNSVEWIKSMILDKGLGYHAAIQMARYTLRDKRTDEERQAEDKAKAADKAAKEFRAEVVKAPEIAAIKEPEKREEAIAKAVGVKMGAWHASHEQEEAMTKADRDYKRLVRTIGEAFGIVVPARATDEEKAKLYAQARAEAVPYLFGRLFQAVQFAENFEPHFFDKAPEGFPENLIAENVQREAEAAFHSVMVKRHAEMVKWEDKRRADRSKSDQQAEAASKTAANEPEAGAKVKPIRRKAAAA